ncbi:MAG: heavy-metal-associated domain-containing protein [Prevotella sp.]|nr:heavy-metal-associated domain-containing protein [Prevotella sp.]MBR1767697.1 heavy-metal-associated domain-containing protein [Prevotella sp.]
MKRLSFIIFALSFSVALFAKDIKTIVLKTQPEMHCTGCEKKIKENIRFEKGVKSITTNLDDKTVTIEYDADKTNVKNIIEGFKKIKYEATEVKSEPEKKVDAVTGATQKK